MEAEATHCHACVRDHGLGPGSLFIGHPSRLSLEEDELGSPVHAAMAQPFGTPGNRIENSLTPIVYDHR